MSRWLPDSLRVTLAPDRVTVARAPHRLNYGARRRPPPPENTVAVLPGAPEAPPWVAPLSALASVLDAQEAGAEGSAEATVVLSNHFVRYAIVPWSDLIDDDEEAEALSRHGLRQVFGEAADHWELRAAPAADGARRLVGAVDPALLAALRETFALRDLRLVSIQPRLMAVFNGHRRRLGREDAWLAMAEPGSLCLALVRHGDVVRLRHLRLGAAWPAELLTALERETYMADADTDTREVYLSAPPDTDLRFPPEAPWNIRLLAAATAQGA